LAKTGSGKSTNIRALLAREAEQGTQIIILDPQPHVRRFVNMSDPDAVAYHRVGYGRLTFNPLDVVWDRLDQQSDYVRAIFKIMLNPDGATSPAASTP
jgi:ABC-type phosphonate transport system ATPase subunit